MKKEQYYDKTNLVFYKFLNKFCLTVLFISALLFLYLFFYQSMVNSYKDFKQSTAAPAPIYDAPQIQIPTIPQEKTAQEMISQEKTSQSVPQENAPQEIILQNTQEIVLQSAPQENILQNTAIPTTSAIDNSSKEAERIFIAYELGDYVLSSRLIVDFISEYPTSIYRHKVRLIGAKLMNERGDFEGALSYIQRILGETQLSNEDYSESVLLLGSIARERKQYDSYIETFLEQAYFRAEEPTKSKISFYLGYLLLHKNEYLSSLKYFNNVIGEDGSLGKADLYAAQSMLPERINELENFIKAYPSSKNFEYVKSSFIKDVLSHGRDLVIRGYLDSAERNYTKILTHFNNTEHGDQAQLEIADLYYKRQKFDQSMVVLRKVLANEDTTKDADALFALGKIAFEMDKLEESLTYFRRLTEEHPKSTHISKSIEWQNLIIESLRY